jgi:hypothetical protein
MITQENILKKTGITLFSFQDDSGHSLVFHLLRIREMGDKEKRRCSSREERRAAGEIYSLQHHRRR